MPENMMTKDVKEWLSARALRLRTLEAGGPAADLQPWAGVLKDVRIVGLGEATHGTREFFLLKHRLVEFLVRDLGFRTLAMEAPAAATCSVNAYVLHGTGDARSAVARLGFWTWKTEEVLALVEWMRGYNASVAGDRRVRFVGIDPQLPAPAIGRLDAFLRRVAPERAVALRDVFDLLAAAQPGSHPDSGGRLVGAVRELVEWITADGVRPAAGTGVGEADEVTRAVEDARTLLRAADMASRPLLCEDRKDSGLAARDRHMADAVAEALGEGSGGVVVWAHNGHVLKGRYASGVPALGSHLAMRYGDAYYALGLLFGRGAFRARRGDDAVRPPARHRISGGGLRSVEGQLAAACRVDHLVDLRPGKKGPEVNRWLTAGHYTRCFGAGVPRFTYRFQFMPTVLAEEYDGLAYVAWSSCSRPLDLPASDGR